MNNMPCRHLEFASEVSIAPITESDTTGEIIGYVVEIAVYCISCGEHLRFLGLPTGISLKGPSVSASGTEARLAAAVQG